MASDYVGYENWKNWGDGFSCDDQDREYFNGELGNIKFTCSKILEIGFGSGSFLRWCRYSNIEVVGVEVNENLLKRAKNMGYDVRLSNLLELEKEFPERFDCIVAFDVFEHLPMEEIRTTLRSSEALLKPGGHLLLRFPNSQSPFGLAAQFGDPTHRSMLSRSVFEQLIFRSRFKILDYRRAYRISHGNKWLIRKFRYACRDIISAIFRFIYCQDIPFDSIVVLHLVKK